MPAETDRQADDEKGEAYRKLRDEKVYEDKGLAADIFCLRLYPLLVAAALVALGVFLFGLWNEMIDFGWESMQLALADTADTLLLAIVLSLFVLVFLRFRIAVLSRYLRSALGKSNLWLALALTPIAGLVLVFLALRALSTNEKTNERS